MNEQELLDLIATLDQRLKAAEAWIEEQKGMNGSGGVYFDGMPEYVREYVMNTSKGDK